MNCTCYNGMNWRKFPRRKERFPFWETLEGIKMEKFKQLVKQGHRVYCAYRMTKEKTK